MSLMILLMMFALFIQISTVRAGFLSPTRPTSTTAFRYHRQAMSRRRRRMMQSSSSSALFATKVETNDKMQTQKIPISLLSGFLGSGKTSTLKHLLENTEGTKIGVIVNDVAEVNVDAKLVSRSTNANAGGIMELQNGCVCCSLAGELVTTVDNLIESQKKKKSGGGGLDAVVIELSGVADPVAIKTNWNIAKAQKHPVTKKSDIANVVTLVDACTFGTDWMTSDTAGERPYWIGSGDSCSENRQVTELLAEQVEAANVILINKVDMANPKEIETASMVARGLNKDAKFSQVEHGKVVPSMVLGSLLDEKEKTKEKEEKSSSHDHSHDHQESANASHDPDCADPDCTGCSHDHQHTSSSDVDCTDSDCTDTTHSHSHSHSAASTSTDNLGISNFVYKRDRPFDGTRLMGLLSQWPVPKKDFLDLKDMHVKATEEAIYWGERQLLNSPFVGVLRSKGFCWTAPEQWHEGVHPSDAWRHDTALFWSQAGRHFSITTAGKWWGTIPLEDMKKFITDEKEYDRILKEDFVGEEWADRRQEIVFIGTGISEEAITEALDECLVTDEELEDYRIQLRESQASNVRDGW